MSVEMLNSRLFFTCLILIHSSVHSRDLIKSLICLGIHLILTQNIMTVDKCGSTCTYHFPGKNKTG